MGIGGIGQSAIAQLADACGYKISGCDLEHSSITNRLSKSGIPVVLGHDINHLRGVDILAHTPAVYYQSSSHPEYLAAKKKGIAMIGEEFLAKYLQKTKFVIAVSGTHGKGTTSSLLSRVLETAGTDPTCYIGVPLLDWEKRNFRTGTGKYFVCEADEFREKFLLYHPSMIIVTSIEMDHPEYFRDLESIYMSFLKLVRQMREPHLLVLNANNAGCKQLAKKLKAKKFPVKIAWYSSLPQKVDLQLPGEQIRSDAAAAWKAAELLGISKDKIRKGLESFSGNERRFEYRGEANGVKIYDDYAHHPTAITANIAAAREKYPGKRIWAVLQPHMYSRLQALFPEFVSSLRTADKVVVTDVYTRREQGITSPSGKDLSQAVGSQATYVGGDLQNVAKFVERNTKKGDVVLMLGAGDIYKVSDYLLSGHDNDE